MSMEFQETMNRFWWGHEVEKQLGHVGKEVKSQISIANSQTGHWILRNINDLILVPTGNSWPTWDLSIFHPISKPIPSYPPRLCNRLSWEIWIWYKSYLIIMEQNKQTPPILIECFIFIPVAIMNRNHTTLYVFGVWCVVWCAVCILKRCTHI